MDQLNEILSSLPKMLFERIRVIGEDAVAGSGEFVLYWMRTAIRTDENPALQVAIEVANQLGLPLLVYQGLSERYPYASDRHHTFVLQGARDVQAKFAETNIRYILHVERPSDRGPHLKTLSQRAAVVVTEEMPTDPLRRWTTHLSRVVSCSLLAVDTACVVPMQLVGKSYERAFAFRNATKKLYAERVSLEPHECQLEMKTAVSTDLPFDSVDLVQRDIPGIVGECEIDHSIGPVPHTPGGSVAGYQRWQEFMDRGLSAYDRRRNNPLSDGASRMSAYLHYGMVAPTRIAREAAAAGTKGAEKYLDELLIWRELAYAFCHFRRDHGKLSAIPEWARETLREHESDRRELLSWEKMARGRTGDSIWDSAQRSLLIHGELHNNVRMTWGKAVLNWTPDAHRALARLIDLNHRYALDGRDPASYGGILWCLGQFDRPFEPPQPIIGTVRSRSTKQHAQRLDPVTYRRKVTRPLWAATPRVAVVGAGIAGLACARTLADHGCEVTVFEKSRGFGGRMSTRRADGNLSFDHGAQYFTARDKRFKRYVRSWVDEGIVQPWTGRVVTIDGDDTSTKLATDNRFVAVPGMSSLGHHLASDLHIQRETKVAPPVRIKDSWSVANEDGDELGDFDFVLIAVPAHQATQLMEGAPQLASLSGQVKMSCCWTLMLAFERSLQLDFEGAFVDHSSISWIASNGSKPGRNADQEAWVVQADPQWSETQMEEPADFIRRSLLDEFRNVVGRSEREPTHLDAKLWRFAIPVNPLEKPCLFDEGSRIGACGDWCGGKRVEAAFLSGLALAGKVLGSLNGISPAPSNRNEQLALF